MANIAIYYQKDPQELAEQAIQSVNEVIPKLETIHTVKGVFIDLYNENFELFELLNSRLEDIDIIYMNREIQDDFIKELISQLRRYQQFELNYFKDIK